MALISKTCTACGHVQTCFCGECHSCYSYTMVSGGGAGQVPPTVKPPGSAARTQKGVGLVMLSGVFGGYVLPIQRIAQKPEDLAGVNWPMFARPCPSSPKHGYIDSRVVTTEEEAKELLKEVLADDKEGELLITPFQKAQFNMIWTPSSIVVGPGHDGATAGKKAITIPLAGTMPEGLNPEVLKKARVTEWPYIEAVQVRGGYGVRGTVLTQLRSGPKIEGAGGDYIPKAIKVLKVLKADAAKFKDREWEVLIDKVASEPGVVVWHPGGALTDHFSIHSFTHQIPVIFSHEPKVGDELEPIEGHDTKFDPEAMLKGLVVGEKLKLFTTDKQRNVDQGVHLLLLALHNATAMTGENSKWIGVATAIMLRLGVTALRGEARHLGISLGAKPVRDTVYKASLPLKLSRHRASVNRLVNMFRYGEFGSSSFGGIKWAACGAATVGLFNAVRDLAANPSEDSAARLVRALNVAVNQAHNGGWWLNKFCGVEAFNLIQKAHIPYMLHCSGMAYTAEKIFAAIPAAQVEKALKPIRQWPETTLRPPKVDSVQMTYQPGIDAIGLKFKTRLLKNKARIILAPVSQVVEALDKLVGDCTYLVETDDGFKVEVRHPTKGTFTLWADDSIKTAAEKAAEGGAK